MKSNVLAIILLAMLMAVPAGCKNGSRQQAAAPGDSPVQVPRFNADSAYSYVAEQVAFGYRVPGTDAHRNTARWLVESLRRHGAEVVTQQAAVTAYDGTQLPICNIIASYAPGKKSRILLLAHWDSRPYADHDPDPAARRLPIDGANDGASGVGVLLEIARHLAATPPAVGVDILLVDAEDYGAPEGVADDGSSWALGSQYWAAHPHVQGYKALYAILLDMVGARGATFYREQFSHYRAPEVIDKVWQCAARLGYGYMFINEQGGAVTDDHIYINAYGIPAIDIIHQDLSSPTGFFAGWHTRADNMQQIDKNVLQAVGQTVMTVLYEEGN